MRTNVRRRWIGWTLALPLIMMTASPALAAGAATQPTTTSQNTTGRALVPVISLNGSFQERPSGPASLFGTQVQSLRDTVVRIEKAAADPKVGGLLMQVGATAVGWGKLQELRQALAKFRKTGKKVYCCLHSTDTIGYLLAISADEICLVPSGSLFLPGLRAEVMFWTGLLEDHLKIQADFIHIGRFKGAAEPLTRRTLSKELRAQLNLVLDDMYGQMIGMIAKGRQLKEAKVRQLIDRGLFTASDAKKAKLVDRVQYRDEYLDSIRKRMKRSVRFVSGYGVPRTQYGAGLQGMMQMVQTILGPQTEPSLKTGKPKIALIYAEGTIVTGKGGTSLFGGSSVGSDTIVKALRRASAEPEVVAIVLRINSPGGSALASDLIWREVTRSQKIIIASMSDVAASGGYYIAMGADQIIAQPGTVTGSIGVVGGKLVIKGLFDMLHLNTEVLTRGKHATVFSSQSKFSPTERQLVKRLMKDTYDQFVGKAAKGRKRTVKAIDAVAEGREWTGRQALKHGLIDRLGGLQDAIALAKSEAGMGPDDDVEIVVLPRLENPLQQLMKRFGVQKGPSLEGLPFAEQLRVLEPLLHLQRERIMTIMPYVLTIR